MLIEEEEDDSSSSSSTSGKFYEKNGFQELKLSGGLATIILK